MKHYTPLLLVFALVLCVGCASKGRVTLENAKKVSAGMTEQEVNATLGKPSQEPTPGVKVYFENPSGGNDDITGVIVGINNGKVESVILTGQWEGK